MGEQERRQKQQEKEEEEPVALPSAPVIRLAGNATLQPPLTRRGDGPGLVIVVPPGTPQSTRDKNSNDDKTKNKSLDPLPQKKWAEEGYAVVQLSFINDEKQRQAGEGWDIATGFSRSIEALEKLDTCSVKERFGLIGKS
jgi:carboxymethylenebutenolidase